MWRSAQRVIRMPAPTFVRQAIGLAVLASMASGAMALDPGLQARDFNQDGITDAYYEVSTNLLWLADANTLLSSHYQDPNAPGFELVDPDGSTDWDTATIWANTLNVHGVTGWRLPTLAYTQTCTPVDFHQICSQEVVDGSSELGHLVNVTLGNTLGSLSNTGPFQGVNDGYYWTDTLLPSGARSHGRPLVWYQGITTGRYGQAAPGGLPHLYAWAVRSGDLALPAIPEPSALWLAGMGVVALVGLTRRRRAA